MTEPRDFEDDRDEVVLGVEMAAASAIEQIRQAGQPGPSPLDDIEYHGNEGIIESPSFRPVETDDYLRSMAATWASMSPAALADLRSRLTMGDFYTLMAFARRAVVLTLRTADPAWLHAAVSGLSAIAYERVDFRDLTLAVGLVAYGLDETTGDARTPLEDAAARSDVGTAEVLTRFAVNPPPWTLEDCGFQRTGEGEALVIVRRDFKSYAPRRDLASVARALSVQIEADTYTVESITIATALPAIWLKGPAGHDPTRSLETATGCASVRAIADGSDRHEQMFVAWLLELGTESDARAIARAATASTVDHARLALSTGALCLVLIARSTVHGIANGEDDQSLQRFADGFRSVLRRAAT